MANRFQSLIDGEEEKKKPVIKVNSSNGGNRFGSLLEQPTSQPINQTSQIANNPTSQPLQQESSTWDKIKVGDIKGLANEVGLGLSHGLSKTGTAQQNTQVANVLTNSKLPFMAKLGQDQQAKIKQENDFLEANPVNSVPAMIGEEIVNIPLWMAGEGAVNLAGKGLSKLAPTANSKLSKLPNFIKGGLKDATAYGTVVAPVTSIRDNDTLEEFIDKEKQLPGVLLGGTVIRGIGAGAKLGKDVAGEGGSLRQALALRKINPEREINISPLNEVQNAYKTATLRDAQANELNKTFQNTSNLMSPVQLKTLQQGIDDAVGVREPLSKELVRQRKADVKSALSLRPGTEVPLPQRKLPKNSKPLTWTNRDGIPDAGNLPIKSITENNLGQLPGAKGNIPLKTELQPASIRNKSVAAEIEKPRNMTTDIEVSNRLVIEPVRRQNELPRNTQTTKIVGAEPNVQEGLKERGFARNTRTDVNNPDALRNSYTENPLTYEQLGNKDTLAKAQAIFDQGYESAIAQLEDLATNMKPEAIPLAKLLSRQATESGNIQGAREIISNVADKLTQAGQFSQAARILREADPETFLMTIGKQLKKLNQEGLETYGKKWKDFDLTPDELNSISKIERGNQQAYEDVFEKIQSRIANEMPASAMEKVNAWRHMSMLLNPKTHIRNVVGNGIMMGMRKSAQRVSGVLQKVLPQEQRTQSVFINKEYKDLANQYFEANKKDLLSGANKYQDNVSVRMPNKRVFRKSRIGEKLGKDVDVLEKTRKFNYELLQKGDNPFFRKAYVDRLASYAQSKGIKDFSKLSQEAFDIAKLEAEEATYKDANIIAEFINKVKNPQKDANIFRKGGAVLTEAALPFTKTPLNIISRGVQYSPLGILNGLARINSKKGATDAIDNLAKGLTGTGILGLGYLLASKGVLTGKAEKDADLKAYNANTGNSPFSILGKYSYDWAQPFSIPLSVGVEVYNALKSNPEDVAKMNSIIEKNDTSKLTQILNGVYDAVAASGDTVFNMSVLRGIKNLLANPNGVTEGIMQLPQSYATQFIPTISNQLAGTIDPTVRQTYVKGDYPESTKNAILSRIPIASKTLEPKQTPFGEDVKRIGNPVGRTLSQFLSPGIVAKDQNIDPEIDAELRRLNEYGFTKQFPTMVNNYIEKTQTHPKVPLTPKETTDYQKRVGQLSLKSFDKTMNSKDYKYAKDDKKKNKSADEIRADLLAKAITEVKAQAKKEILKSKGLK